MGSEQNGNQEDLSGLSIEQIFEQLDGMIRKIDDGEIPLEESFALYERGMRLVKEAGSRIDHVEKKIRVIRGDEA